MRLLVRLSLIALSLAIAVGASWAALGRVAAQTGSASFLPLVLQPEHPLAAPQSVLQLYEVACQAPGANPALESISLRNTSTRPLTITGWTIVNVTQSQTFTFPAFTINGGPSAFATVYGGATPADPDAGTFFWGTTAQIWHLGDRAQLRDASGRLISSLTVSAAGCTPPAEPVPTGIRINDVVCRAPADDPTFEYIELVNNSAARVTITGWKIINTTRGNATYSFPAYTIDAGPDIYLVVYGGIGSNRTDIGEFYWGSNAQIWHVGDRVELRTSSDLLVTSLTVPTDSCSL